MEGHHVPLEIAILIAQEISDQSDRAHLSQVSRSFYHAVHQTTPQFLARYPAVAFKVIRPRFILRNPNNQKPSQHTHQSRPLGIECILLERLPKYGLHFEFTFIPQIGETVIWRIWCLSANPHLVLFTKPPNFQHGDLPIYDGPFLNVASPWSPSNIAHCYMDIWTTFLMYQLVWLGSQHVSERTRSRPIFVFNFSRRVWNIMTSGQSWGPSMVGVAMICCMSPYFQVSGFVHVMLPCSPIPSRLSVKFLQSDLFNKLLNCWYFAAVLAHKKYDERHKNNLVTDGGLGTLWDKFRWWWISSL